jgi:hypothetical protein
MSTGSASAATTVGSNCGVNDSLIGVSVVSLRNPPGYPLPSAIPSSGVITGWSFSLSVSIPPESGVLQEQVKVFSALGSNEFKVIGESAPSTIATGTNSFPTRIPVQGGDLLGSQVMASNGVQGALLCRTEDVGDEVALVPNDPVLGQTATATTLVAGKQNPIAVTVEPDADGDGYGDETQDKCPTDASTQGPCPTPPPPPAPVVPISLSASAAAKKGLVTVTLTSSAQATVSVGGSVKLGKGKATKLSGGTQIVAPGTLAKFTILFPAKLKAALRQTPSNKKLTLSLSASAPGATTKSLTVKVPGQEKARHHVQRRG